MPTEETSNRPSLNAAGTRIVLACLLIGAATLSPTPARAQGDPPHPRPARDLETATTPWLPGERPIKPADVPAAPEGAQSAAGRLAFQSIRDGNWEIYFGSDDRYATPTRLTANPAADVQPRLSPDVSRIVFASRRSGNYDLWLMNVDGSGLRQLTSDPATDSAPTWSPDGTRLAFASGRGGNTDVYVMNADGSGVTQLTTNADYDGEPAWSPDGTQIAFVSRRSAGGGDYFLYTMNAQGGAQTLRSPVAYSSRPNWSPDGARILFDGAATGGWIRPYVYTLSGGATQLLQPISGIYAANYDLWAGGWGQGAQAYTTLVSYVLVDGTWYIESMALYSLMTDSAAAGAVTGQQLDANPDWRNPDRLPPITVPLAVSSFRPAYYNGSGFFVNSWDQGIAGIDHVESQYRNTDGGPWQDGGLGCFWLVNLYDCSGTASQPFVEYRVRAVDRMGNAEPWPDTPGSWISERRYRLRINGTVTDLRGTLLADVPLGGVATFENSPVTDGAGHYRVHVKDLTVPLTFMLTATLNGGATGVPRLFQLDTLGWFDDSFTANADFALRSVDQKLSDPSFDTSLGAWVKAGSLIPLQLPAENQYSNQPTRARLGWPNAVRTLAHTRIDPILAITDTATLMVYQDVTLGQIVFRRCGMDAVCDPLEPLGGGPGLALGTAPDGTVAYLHRDDSNYPVIRLRSPAGVWSSTQALPQSAAWIYRVLADSAGRWHALWVDQDGNIQLAHRNADASWTTPIAAGRVSFGLTALFDNDDRLHVLYCSPEGTANESTWSAGAGLAGPIQLSGDACQNVTVGSLADNGDVYALWQAADGVHGARRTTGGVWISTATPQYPAGLMEVGYLAGHGGRPAIALVEGGLSGKLFVAELSSTNTWTTTAIGTREPSLPLMQSYVAWNIPENRWVVFQRDLAIGDVWVGELTLGGGNDAAIAQTLTLNPTMNRPTLALTYRQTDAAAALTIGVQAAGSPGSAVQQLPAGPGWQRGWIDLAAFAGQTITVTVGVSGPAETWPVADIDEIVLGSWTTPLVSGLSATAFDAPAGTLTVTGDNFLPGVSVRIGGQPAAVTRVDAQHLTVTVPPSVAYGRQMLVVVNPDGFATAASVSIQVGRGLVYLPGVLRNMPANQYLYQP